MVVTADNMTSELLKNAFAHNRKEFAVESLTGSSQKIIAELGSNKADVALISEELQDRTSKRASRFFRSCESLNGPLPLCSCNVPNPAV